MADPTLEDFRANPLVQNFEAIKDFMKPDFSGPNDGMSGLMKAIEVAGFAFPLVRPIKRGLKALGQRGAFNPSSLNKIIGKIKNYREKVGGKDVIPTHIDAHVPNPSPNRSGMIDKRDELDHLVDFKYKNFELDEGVLSAKQDMARLVNPYVHKNFKKQDIVPRLKKNSRLANDAMSQMSSEDQKQVRNALKNLGK